MTERFDPDLLDAEEPFEIDDGNRPHLFKRSDLTAQDLHELWVEDAPRLFPADAEFPADWDLVGEITGKGVVVVPLGKPRKADIRKARPITIFAANLETRKRYREES